MEGSLPLAAPSQVLKPSVGLHLAKPVPVEVGIPRGVGKTADIGKELHVSNHLEKLLQRNVRVTDGPEDLPGSGHET
jgi:hypothetical protein